MPDSTALTIPLDNETPVACPHCGSTAGLHFDEVSLIDPLGAVVPLHADGDEALSVVTATLSDGTLPGRRHLVVLPHWCAECGRRGEIVLRQQSGQTVGQLRDVPARSPENVAESASTV